MLSVVQCRLWGTGSLGEPRKRNSSTRIRILRHGGKRYFWISIEASATEAYNTCCCFLNDFKILVRGEWGALMPARSCSRRFHANLQREAGGSLKTDKENASTSRQVAKDGIARGLGEARRRVEILLRGFFPRESRRSASKVPVHSYRALPILRKRLSAER
jgi:hypothetical protein